MKTRTDLKVKSDNWEKGTFGMVRILLEEINIFYQFMFWGMYNIHKRYFKLTWI